MAISFCMKLADSWLADSCAELSACRLPLLVSVESVVVLSIVGVFVGGSSTVLSSLCKINNKNVIHLFNKNTRKLNTVLRLKNGI